MIQNLKKTFYQNIILIKFNYKSLISFLKLLIKTYNIKTGNQQIKNILKTFTKNSTEKLLIEKEAGKTNTQNIYNKNVIKIDQKSHLEHRGTKRIILKVSAKIKAVKVISTKLLKKLLNIKNPKITIVTA